METLLKANEQAKNHDIDISKLPQNVDVTAESITANVHAINENCQPSQHFFKNMVLNVDSLSRPGWSHEVYIQESRRLFSKFLMQNIINDCFPARLIICMIL